jgi:hypothetical protein
VSSLSFLRAARPLSVLWPDAHPGHVRSGAGELVDVPADAALQ